MDRPDRSDRLDRLDTPDTPDTQLWATVRSGEGPDARITLVCRLLGMVLEVLLAHPSRL